MAKPFTGTINLDIRDSVPDWDAFLRDSGVAARVPIEPTLDAAYDAAGAGALR
jgi:hypothetical protein